MKRRNRTEVRLDENAHIQSIEPPEDAAEAAQTVRSLISNRQVDTGKGSADSPLGTTHKVEVDAGGNRTLKRARFRTV